MDRATAAFLRKLNKIQINKLRGRARLYARPLSSNVRFRKIIKYEIMTQIPSQLYIKTFLIIGCEISGLFLVSYAFIKRASNKNTFKFKNIFENLTLGNSSTTQLIIEGIFLIIAGVLLVSI